MIHRLPSASNANPSGIAPRSCGPYISRPTSPRRPIAQPRDLPGVALDDVQPFFARIEPHLVRARRSLPRRCGSRLVHHRHIAVLRPLGDRARPGLEARRDGDPEAILESRSTKLVLPSGCRRCACKGSLERPCGSSARWRSCRSSRSGCPRSGKREAVGQRAAQDVLVRRACLLEARSTCCAMSCWLPSGAMRMTPPRASALQSVPSGSARMHSGRCRSRPTNAISSGSTAQPRSSFALTWRTGSGRYRPRGRRSGR